MKSETFRKVKQRLRSIYRMITKTPERRRDRTRRYSSDPEMEVIAKTLDILKDVAAKEIMEANSGIEGAVTRQLLFDESERQSIKNKILDLTHRL